jgi:hypothetical protein
LLCLCHSSAPMIRACASHDMGTHAKGHRCSRPCQNPSMICGLHVEQNGYYIVLVCVESGGPGWVGRVQRAGRAGWAAVPSRPHLRAVFACLSSLIGVRRDISGHLSQRVAVGPACHSGMRIACRLGRGPSRGASAQYRVIAGIAVPVVALGRRTPSTSNKIDEARHCKNQHHWFSSLGSPSLVHIFAK